MERLQLRMAKREGFTIVELLIVIVVIAILAAIVIVAYNGVTARASAASLESIVDEYRKGLVSYVTANGNYPLTNSGFCLGQTSDYPNGCFSGISANSTASAALQTQMSTLPHVDSSCHYMYGTSCRRNLTLFYQAGATLDGSPHSYYLTYFLDGSQNCTLSGNVGGSWTTYTSKPNATGYLERDTSSGVTMCVIALPDPGTT